MTKKKEKLTPIYTVYRDRAGRFRWEMRNKRDELIGASHRSWPEEIDADANFRAVVMPKWEVC